ncbi:MAG: hypothetical protein CL678_08655 [Bdellovibrionaceae bacterium]|nr:hypothetical protein [Pseudobdellovibrionaceae bacterium]|tara:strand:- start:468 stop:1802 length:1335 start_codon:yes stop_codon:yes gene_type:complete
MKNLFTLILILISFQSYAIEVEFEPDARVPLVDISLVVRTGAVSDPKNQEGLTRFVGQMLLRGTKVRSKKQLDLKLDELGASIGVETRDEALILRASVLSSQIDPFLDLFLEIITQPSFSIKEIRKLKKKTQSLILSGLSDDGNLVKKNFAKFLFKNHPYGNSVLGTLKSISKLTQTQIVSQYNRIFSESLMVVVGTGDTTKEMIKAFANKIAKARPEPSRLIGLKAPHPIEKRKILLVNKPDRSQFQIFGGHIGMHPTNPDYIPAYIANYAFGGSFTSRFMKEIRVKRGWSYWAYSYFRHGSFPKTWSFTLAPANQYATKALKEAIYQIENLRENGITKEEFIQAKTGLINNSGFRYDTPSKRIENRITEIIYKMPKGSIQNYGEKFKEVTFSEANEALKKFLHPDHLHITIVTTVTDDLKKQISKVAHIPVEEIEVIDYQKE